MLARCEFTGRSCTCGTCGTKDSTCSSVPRRRIRVSIHSACSNLVVRQPQIASFFFSSVALINKQAVPAYKHVAHNTAVPAHLPCTTKYSGWTAVAGQLVDLSAVDWIAVPACPPAPEPLRASLACCHFSCSGAKVRFERPAGLDNSGVGDGPVDSHVGAIEPPSSFPKSLLHTTSTRMCPSNCLVID